MMDTMTTEKPRTRREHSEQLKAQIVAECDVPGASVAKVAMAHGVNANLVHGWRKLDRERREAAATALQTQAMPSAVNVPTTYLPFVPVSVTPSDDATIDIEVRRGAVTIKVSWPMSAASQCAAWARELLK
jgi:transposase